MKYNETNRPLVCMMTQSTCYQNTSKMNIKGILWHSTGANNPNLRRYVQPDDDSKESSYLLQKLGINNYKNDHNHIYLNTGVNAWIGKLADGSVASVQTLPWYYMPWGCGKGKKGSCNNGWIQFEICEDGLSDSKYFDEVYKEACELTAYLCKLYNIDPKGVVAFNRVNVPTILCHRDSYELGLGSNHSDIYHWFTKFGRSMNTVREDVSKLLEEDSTTVSVLYESINIGDILIFNGDSQYTSADSSTGIKAKSGKVEVTKKYKESSSHPIHVRSVDDKGNYISGVYGWVDLSSLALINSQPYRVKINVSSLNRRSGPSISYPIVGVIKDEGVYTIIQENNGWGLLKSKVGWINLKYTKRV